MEIRKALDRLYALTLDETAVRNLRDISAVTPPKKLEDGKEAEKGVQKNTLEVIMEKHAVLLKASMEKTDELKKLMEEQRDMPVKTYASVATTGPAIETNKPEQRPALHSVIVSSTDEQETGEEVLERIRKTVKAKEGWINVERVRKAKDRKIVVGCATEEERRKLKDRLEKKGENFVVEEAKNRDPLLVLKDVISKHSDGEILEAVKNQNREIFDSLKAEQDRMAIKYRKKARNPHTSHVVLTVSPTIWRRVLDAGKLRIDLQRVYVEDQSPLVQCSKCLGYGHGRRFCGETEELCSHCSGPHLSAGCPDKVVGEPAECVNCKRAKLENRKHNAFSQECPVRKKWDAIARASVAYC